MIFTVSFPFCNFTYFFFLFSCGPCLFLICYDWFFLFFCPYYTSILATVLRLMNYTRYIRPILLLMKECRYFFVIPHFEASWIHQFLLAWNMLSFNLLWSLDSLPSSFELHTCWSCLLHPTFLNFWFVRLVISSAAFIYQPYCFFMLRAYHLDFQLPYSCWWYRSLD